MHGMMLQLLIDGPAQSQGEWLGFAIIALGFAIVPWAWHRSARKQGREVALREVIIASLAFLALAAFSFFEAMSQR